MSDLRDLYQEVIIDHSRHPRNFQELISANRKAEGFNRLCGDKLTLFLLIEDDKIKKITFIGTGCAISTASASLMTEQLQEKTLAEAKNLFQDFHQALTAKQPVIDAQTNLGKLAVLLGVRDYPSRVKCATLAWHTLHAALTDSHESVSTE